MSKKGRAITLYRLVGIFLMVQTLLVALHAYLSDKDHCRHHDTVSIGKYILSSSGQQTQQKLKHNEISTSTHSSPRKSDANDFALASHESYGFFDDIPEAAWRLKQHIARSTPHHLDAQHDKVSTYYYRPRGWYQNNWEPDFSCSFESFLGGPIRDGHKWVCDPHRIKKEKDCLVYSFGSNGDFDFEDAVLELAPHCELHVFDPGYYRVRMKGYAHLANKPNVTYHTYGMKASYETDPDLLDEGYKMPDGVFKTFSEIISKLGHEGRTISIFKVDIETGEWTTFRDWLDNSTGMRLQQILVEVHGAPLIANEFFATMHKAGYAMFHKEPNIEFSSGDCIEFGFIKLRPSFFDHDDMPVYHSSQALAHEAKNKEEYVANRGKPTFNYSREMSGTGAVEG